MKRLILTIITVLTAALCSVCLFGCFGAKNNNEDGAGNIPPDPPIEQTGLQAPTDVKLDQAEEILYVSDCSGSGATYYEVEHRTGIYENIIGKLDASSLTAENGYFAIPLSKLSLTSEEETLTVRCKTSAAARDFASKKFTFTRGGKVEYDTAKCSFDSASGLFTWTAVDGAIGYKIKSGGTRSVVTEPRYTAPDSVDEFSVAPLFEDGKLFGAETNIELYGFGMWESSIDYRLSEKAFTWSEYPDSTYTVTVKGGGADIETTTTESRYEIVPSAGAVTLGIIINHPLRRAGELCEKTFDFLPEIEDIALDADGRLSWSQVASVTQYKVEFVSDDGNSRTQTATEPQLKLDARYFKAGKITASISPTVTDRNKIVIPTEFVFYAISPQKITPTVTAPSDGKLDISIPVDGAVASYAATVAYGETRSTKTVNASSAQNGKLSLSFDLPSFEVATVAVTRQWARPLDELFILANGEDYEKKFIALPPPELVATDKTLEKITARAIFPERLIGKGKLALRYSYKQDKTEIFAYGTENFTADSVLPALTRPSGTTAELTAYYYGYKDNAAGSVTVLSSRTVQAVGCLPRISAVMGDTHIGWQSVAGASGYTVERREGGEYTEVYNGGDTEYAHGITAAGQYGYRVASISSDGFTFDGEYNYYRIVKLSSPTVTFTEDGTLAVAADEGDDLAVKLDGAASALDEASIRAAFEGKTHISLEARATRTDGGGVHYIPSDAAVRELYRISGGLSPKVDNAASAIGWTATEHASSYRCALYRKETASAAYASPTETESQTNALDGATIPWGYIKLEVSPKSYADGENVYLYLDEAEAIEFRKDGIKEVGVKSGGCAFSIKLFTANTPSSSFAIGAAADGASLDGDYTPNGVLDFSESEQALTALAALSVGGHELTFRAEYGANEALICADLDKNNILRASDFVMPFEVRASVAPTDFDGSYVWRDLEDNSALNVAQATIAVKNHTLNGAESYAIVKSYERADGVSVYIDTTDGLTTEVKVEEYSRTYRLKVKTVSDRFLTEDGDVAFYKSSGESATSYDIRANLAYTATADHLAYTPPSGTKSAYFSYKLSFINHDSNIKDDAVTIEYKLAGGEWTKLVASYNRPGEEQFKFYFKNSNEIDGYMTTALGIYGDINPGDTVSVRVRHCAAEGRDQSGLYYLNITVPAAA